MSTTTGVIIRASGTGPPIERFRLAKADPAAVVELDEDVIDDEPLPAVTPRVTRVVNAAGAVSVAGHRYRAGRWLALETVEITTREGLLEISHRGVLVATHAQRHPKGAEPAALRQRSPRRTQRPNAKTVTRKVDSTGSVSFAGTSYRVGNAHRGQSAEVSLVGDTVQIHVDGQLVRTHPIRHDRAKEHGAFATPTGRPRRINAA